MSSLIDWRSFVMETLLCEMEGAGSTTPFVAKEFVRNAGRMRCATEGGAVLHVERDGTAKGIEAVDGVAA
jgi:hypothetical protein